MSYFTTGAALTAALNALPASLTGTYKAFDAFYYADKYMGAYAGTLTPIEHFVQVGAARGYQPNADFNPAYYQSQFSDLANYDAAELLYHYVAHGLNEGRPGNATLAANDWSAYLAAYPDVAKYVTDNLASFGGSMTNGAIAHYVKFGQAQGFTLPNTVGQTFTLTTGIDTGAAFTGTIGNDTFTAVINEAATPTTTLNAGDSLVGGNGTDTLLVVVQDNTVAGVGGFFTNGIENINIQVADVAGETFSLLNASGVQAITSQNSAGALTANNVQSNAKVVLSGANANVTANYANALVAGSADAAEVEINGAATVANVAINLAGQSAGGFETVNVKSTGAASGSATAGTRVTIDDGAANSIKTVNISGDAAARLTATLDGAAATSSTTVGAVTVTNTAGVNVTVAGAGRTYVSVTGGAGNDTINVTNLDSNSTIAGGDGTDTLNITDSTALASTAFRNVTGFEKIQLGGALNATQNLASAGAVTDVILSAATAGGTISGVASGLNLQMTATGGTNAAVLLNNAATSTTDVLNVQIGSAATTTANLAVGTLNINNIETVNLTSSSREEVTAGHHSIALSSDAALTALTIKGNESIAVTSSGGSTLLASVDASAATSHVNTTGLTLSALAATVAGGTGNDTISGAAGNDSLAGNAGNDVITAGAGNDVVSGGEGNDTLISGGAGNDKFEGDAGNDRFVFAAAELTSNDTVTGGEGTNTLVISSSLAGNALADSAFRNVTGITTITAANSAVTATANDGANNTTGTLEMTLNTAAQAAGITTVAAQFNATTGATTGTNAILATVQEGFTNALTFKIGDTAGADRISAGATTATITVSGAANAFDAADVFVGGSNAGDVMNMSADNSTANLSGMTGFETVNVLAGTTASSTAGLTIGSANVLQSGKSLVVNASALTNDAAAFTFDGSAEVADGTNTGRFNVTSGAGADNITAGAGNDTVNSGANADVIYGLAGNDSINTEAGNDYVDGGAGNDVINGGTGNDTIYGGANTDNLTGGEGNDTYVYAAVTDSTMAGTTVTNATAFTGDTIVGFNAGNGTVAGAVDKLNLPAGWTVNTITSVTIGSASVATFQSDLAANGNLTTALTGAGRIALVTVSGGTAAGTFLIANNGAGAYNSANTLVVKLQDAENLDKLSAANFTVANTVTPDVATALVTQYAPGDSVVVNGTASEIAGANIATLVANGVDSFAITSTTSAASDLNTIDAATTLPIDASAVTTLTGSAAEIAAVLGSAGITRSASVNIVLAAGPATAADIAAIRAATTGTVDGSLLTVINGSAAAVVQALADLTTDPTNFNSTLAAGAATAADIAAIEAANGSGTIDGSALTAINGTATAVVQAVTDLDTDPTNFNSTLTGAASASDIATIEAANGTGTIDGASVTAINGTAAAVVQAVTDLDTDPTNFNSTLTGAASASDIATIEAANGTGTITGTALTAINGTAAAVVQAVTDLDTDPTIFDSTLSGDATVTHLNAIDGVNGTGTITFTGAILATDASDVITPANFGSNLSVKYTAGSQTVAYSFLDLNANGFDNDDTFTAASTSLDDVLTFGAGNTIDLSAFGLGSQAVASATFVADTAKVGDGEWTSVAGSYNTGTGVFTVDATGTGDSLLVLWDSNTTAGQVTQSAVVIVGLNLNGDATAFTGVVL